MRPKHIIYASFFNNFDGGIAGRAKHGDVAERSVWALTAGNDFVSTSLLVARGNRYLSQIETGLQDKADHKVAHRARSRLSSSAAKKKKPGGGDPEMRRVPSTV